MLSVRQNYGFSLCNHFMALLDYCYVQAQLFILLHNKTAFFLADFAHCLLQNSPDDEILHIGAVAVAMKLKSGDAEPFL